MEIVPGYARRGLVFAGIDILFAVEYSSNAI